VAQVPTFEVKQPHHSALTADQILMEIKELPPSPVPGETSIRGLKRMSKTASLALIGANLVMLFAAAYHSWGYEYILAMLWWETVIIGFFNLGRILVVCLKIDGFGKYVGFANLHTRLLTAFFLGMIFIVKFGGFALGVGLVVLMAPAIFTNTEGDGLSASFDAANAVGPYILVPLIALFLSHGISFFQNFVGRQEYQWSGLFKLMFWPYFRLVLLMAVVAIGFLLAKTNPDLGQAPVFTMAVILVKLAVDWGTHKYEHR
jgi:hypothetical protein